MDLIVGIDIIRCGKSRRGQRELVSLGDEMVPIDTVLPGTLAMNSEGFLSPVVSTRRRSYTGEMLKIVPLSVGNAFELTPEHPVWSIRRERVSH